MKETAETLLKHTRNELVEMAEKLGISTASMPKPTIAQSILEARKKATKETPKPKAEPKYKAEVAKVEVPAPVKTEPKVSIGNKGVLAKRAAINTQIKENVLASEMIGTGVKELQNDIENMHSAMHIKAKEMLHQGNIKLQKGVHEMHKATGVQIKENEKAAAKMGKGVKDMQSAIDNKTADLQTGVKEMHSGVKEIQNGIKEMENAFREFQNETANYIKDFYYG